MWESGRGVAAFVVAREWLGGIGGLIGALEVAIGEGSTRVFFAVGNRVTVGSVSLDVALFRFCEAPIIVVNVHGIVLHVRLSSRNFLSRVAPAKAQTMLRTSFRECRTLILSLLWRNKVPYHVNLHILRHRSGAPETAM